MFHYTYTHTYPSASYPPIYNTHTLNTYGQLVLNRAEVVHITTNTYISINKDSQVTIIIIILYLEKGACPEGQLKGSSYPNPDPYLQQNIIATHSLINTTHLLPQTDPHTGHIRHTAA